MFSVAVVLGLVWIAAAYETGAAVPWLAEERMTPDDTFGVIRNAVTAAAALGVGVTLFFSYRRQQTAERTLTYTAKTQRLAVEAQSLAAERLERESLDTLRKRYLEIATLLNSETDLNRITALHALESLIISWRQFKNDREASACLGLLLSTMRLSRESDTSYDKEFLQTAQRLLERHMQSDEKGALSWSGLNFDATQCISPGGLHGWEINGGEITASPLAAGSVGASFTDIRGGTLRLSDTEPDALPAPTSNTIHYVVVHAGRLSITCTGLEPKVSFVACKFEGGVTSVHSTKPEFESQITFISCKFNGGQLRISAAKPTTIRFRRCHFTRPPINRFWAKVRNRTMLFDNCTAVNSRGEKVAIESTEDLAAAFEDEIVTTAVGSRRATPARPNADSQVVA